MIKIFTFKVKNKKFKIKVKECKNFFTRAKGLMFRNNSLPLLFIFKKSSKRSIHSFFCQPFIAIWFLNNEIINIEVIKPYKFYIKPKEKFNILLEIPSNNKEFLTLCKLVRT